jgi:hypothetical protein
MVILAHGFVRARCQDFGHERLIPFSSKGRGICPSCNARRMCEVAAHLTDHVLPHVSARQWVLSVPKCLRPHLHHDVRVAGAVLQILLRAIRTTLRRTSPGAPPDGSTQEAEGAGLHNAGSRRAAPVQRRALGGGRRLGLLGGTNNPVLRWTPNGEVVGGAHEVLGSTVRSVRSAVSQVHRSMETRPRYFGIDSS